MVLQEKTDSDIKLSVEGSAWNSVQYSLRASVWNFMDSVVWNSVENSVGNSVGNSVFDFVESSAEMLIDKRLKDYDFPKITVDDSTNDIYY